LYKTDAANSAPAKPAPSALGTEGYFKNPAGSAAGTTVDADWMNSLQESLIAILDDQSVTHSKSDHSRLLTAINSLVDTKIAAANYGLRGYISGLEFLSHSGSTFTIDAGECRNSADTGTGVLAAAIIKDAAVAWNLTNGGLASNNTWADPYYTRVWAIHKAAGTDINFGFDQDATATNLLSDAASDGFTTARQIGWAVRSGGAAWRQFSNYGQGNYFSEQVGQTAISATAITVTTELTADLNVPEGTIHVGTHSVNVPADVDQDHYAILGHEGATPAATSSAYNLHYNSDAADILVHQVFRQSPAEPGGAATLQGQLRYRFSYAPSPNQTYTVTTEGFYWSRESV
jgi:hypothetical protein